MEPQPLRESLEKLHRELSQAPSLNERGRQLLAEVRRDLDRLHAGAPVSAEEHGQIRERWQSAVVNFEGSHPQIARGLERMANILSNFGL